MRLFLSSYRAGSHQAELLKLLGGINKLAFVSNAKDYKTPSERQISIEENRTAWKSLNIAFHEIDLSPYFHKKGAENLISGFEFVWLGGGNAFLLRRALAYTGLDKYLVEKVKTNGVIFGGESAGAILAGPTLEGSEDKSGNEDNPDYIPPGYGKEVLWDGLGLVDYVPVPHYKTPGIAESIDKYVAYVEKHKIPYKTMKENQAIVVDGDKTEFLK